MIPARSGRKRFPERLQYISFPRVETSASAVIHPRCYSGLEIPTHAVILSGAQRSRRTCGENNEATSVPEGREEVSPGRQSWVSCVKNSRSPVGAARPLPRQSPPWQRPRVNSEDRFVIGNDGTVYSAHAFRTCHLRPRLSHRDFKCGLRQ